MFKERSNKSTKNKLTARQLPITVRPITRDLGNLFPCTRQLAGFLAERSSHRFRLPNILQSTSVTYLWNLHSLITVTRSYRNRTCFPFNRPIFKMKNILYFMYCSISRIKTAGTNYLLYETFNILAYPLPIYNNHFSLANHSKYGILIRYLQNISGDVSKWS